ncbi:hypothetical protein L207DRAFT_513300 [Hyaloscypha variabilis F]|uniref:Uncharacterized protein n=1 Tax=Hyaloscypha variabilis (strain UAMH 11265 / GT02V1 / F) TaxID=1149755 RepID=A0A2J6RJY6_HYAVF|nr:hypothetical protein L207DRAFT_513300 [Hyaloscypha variabilis F]
MNATISPKNIALSCPSTSWPGQSAFYFLLSLALGCISHPRGSLIFNRSSRVWRLSPIFLLIENGEIVFRILECVRAQGWKWRGKAVRVYMYAILALREGNAWSQAEYDAFFEEAENERFLGDEESGENGGMGKMMRGKGSGCAILRIRLRLLLDGVRLPERKSMMRA